MANPERCVGSSFKDLSLCAVLAHIYGDNFGGTSLGAASCTSTGHGMLLLLLELTLVAHAMRFAFVVVVDDLQAKVGVALNEGGAYVGQLAAPFATMAAEHGVGPLVVLQPLELIQPVGPKSTTFPGASSRRARWYRWAMGFSRRMVWLLLMLLLLLLVLLLLCQQSVHGRIQALVLIMQLKALQLSLHCLVEEHLMHGLVASAA